MKRKLIIVLLIAVGAAGYFYWNYKGVIHPGDTFVQGEEISWDKAVDLIVDCKLAMLGQAHSGRAYLTLKNGKKYSTMQPRLDDIFKIEHQCQGMIIFTE